MASSSVLVIRHPNSHFVHVASLFSLPIDVILLVQDFLSVGQFIRLAQSCCHLLSFCWAHEEIWQCAIKRHSWTIPTYLQYKINTLLALRLADLNEYSIDLNDDLVSMPEQHSPLPSPSPSPLLLQMPLAGACTTFPAHRLPSSNPSIVRGRVLRRFLCKRRSLLRRIGSLLGALKSYLLVGERSSFNVGASELQLESCEQKLRRALPESLRCLLAQVNGQHSHRLSGPGAGIFFGLRILSVSEISAEYFLQHGSSCTAAEQPLIPFTDVVSGQQLCIDAAGAVYICTVGFSTSATKKWSSVCELLEEAIRRSAQFHYGQTESAIESVLAQ